MSGSGHSSTLKFNQPPGSDKVQEDEEKKKFWIEKINTLTDKKKPHHPPPVHQPHPEHHPALQPLTVSSPDPSLEPPPEEKKVLEKKGIEEHTKNQAAKVQADRESLDQLIKSSNRSVISISSLFPWDFIPNSINVEETRVTFIFRQLFASQSHSIDIKDISNVFIETSFFTSSLQIVSKTYIENDTKIEYLDKQQAIKTRMIIEGLRTLAQHDIDTSSFSVEELISKIEEMHASQNEAVNG